MILFLISEAVVVMNQSKFDRNLGVLTEKKTITFYSIRQLEFSQLKCAFRHFNPYSYILGVYILECTCKMNLKWKTQMQTYFTQIQRKT